MPFSVALNQPRFAPGDDGLGQWDDIISGITQIATAAVPVATAYITAQNQQTAVARTIAAQTAAGFTPYTGAFPQAVPQTAPTMYAAPTSITSSPMFIPLVAGLGLLLIVVLAGGRR